MNNSTGLNYANNATSTPEYGKIFLPKVDKIPLHFALVYGILALLVIILNGVTVFIFVKKRETRKRKSNLFLLSLSAADLLVGLSSLMYLVFLLSNKLTRQAKLVSTIVLGFSLETSMFSLCCITYERLVGVKDSLTYEKLVTSTTVNTSIIATWVFSLILTSCQGIVAFQFEAGRYFELNGVVIVVLATAISVFLAVVYVYLYLEIRRHSQNIRNTSVSVSCSIDFDATRSLNNAMDVDKPNLDITEEAVLSVLKKKRQKRLKITLSKEKRSLILCSFIVCSFMICWGPVTVFFAGKIMRQHYVTTDFMLYISNCLILFNSLLNPCIYFALRNDLRKAAFSLLCRRPTAQAGQT